MLTSSLNRGLLAVLLLTCVYAIISNLRLRWGICATHWQPLGRLRSLLQAVQVAAGGLGRAEV